MAQPARLSEATAAAPVPPQNLDAEESVLGAMMLAPGAVGAVSEILVAGDFYRESHAKIYRAALALYAKGEPVDAITVVDELDERGELEPAGGRTRIHELAALVPATANAGHYARIVRETATLRGLIRVGSEIAQLGWDRPGETDDLVDRAEQVLFELSQSRVSGEFAHIEDLLKESFERITALYEAGAELTGTPSGFRDIDRLTSGFQPGNLIIIAARPSMGKSALALCMAANVALKYEIPVALFTLEMSKAEVTQRLMCSEAKVESQRLRTGKLAADDWPRLTAACDKLAKAPIYVDDTGSVTMMEVRSKTRRLKSRQPDLGLVIVDYLQLMTSGTNPENRVQEVSQISRQLKVLARDLDVPIIALSQLSRAVEQRHDKRADPVRPTRERVHRAGQRHRHVHLPGRLLRRRVGPAGPGGGRHRQAPERPHRLRQAVVPQALREVRRPRDVAKEPSMDQEQTIWLAPTDDGVHRDLRAVRGGGSGALPRSARGRPRPPRPRTTERVGHLPERPHDAGPPHHGVHAARRPSLLAPSAGRQPRGRAAPLTKRLTQSASDHPPSRSAK